MSWSKWLNSGARDVGDLEGSNWLAKDSDDEEHFDGVGENVRLFVFTMVCARTIWARARTIGLCGVVVGGLIPSML